MELTILGSGEMTGVPLLFSDLESAGAEARRRRPSLLVETSETTVLLDVSPDVREQVQEAGIDGLDAAFLTHFHHDHAGGIDDLAPYVPHLDIDCYLTETALGHCREERGYLLEDLDPSTVDHGEEIRVGDLTVVPFPVAHGRPDFDTVGFAVAHDGATAVYAPDVEQFCPERPAGDAYRDADLLFVEASPLFRDELFPELDFSGMLSEASADRTVLIHVNEFLDGPTGELAATAADHGFELGADFETYSV
jgi:phosphoribosyl 1,2-cyclic phosphate phosphodiesterase